MALTERLAVIIDAKADGATREFKKLSGEAKKTDDATQKLSTSAAAMGVAFKTAAVIGLGYAAIKLVKFAGDSVQAASDLSETVNKVGVVFGETTDEVLAFGKGSNRAMGMSENAALSAASAFGQFFDAAGMGGKATADMSTRLVKLSADLASFNNADPSEVLENLRSGLAGEAEPLRKFGVFLSDATIKSYAYANGIAAAGAELTEGQKIQARYGVILEQTTKAQGDFERTSGGLANQQRILSASVEDLKASLGEALLPAMQKGVAAANGLLATFNALPPGVQQTAVAITGIAGVAAITVPKVLELKQAFDGLDKTQLAKSLGKAGVAGAFLALAAAATVAAGESSKLGTSFDSALAAFSRGTGNLEDAKAALDAINDRQKDLAHNAGLWDTIGDTIGSVVEQLKHWGGGTDLIDKSSEATARLYEEQLKYGTALYAVQQQTGLSQAETKKLADTYGLDLTKGVSGAAAALTATYDEQIKASQATQQLDAVSKILTDTTAEMKDKTDAYTGALQSMTGTILGATNAEIGFQSTADSLTEKFAELTTATKEGDKATRDKALADLAAAQALDLNEAAGRDVVSMLGKLAQDAASVASETYKQTGSVAAATSVYNTHVGQIDKVIGELGLNKDAVKGLIGQYDQVPSSITTAVKAETGGALNSLDAYRQALIRLDGMVATTYTREVTQRYFQDSGVAGPTGRAIGGPVATDRVYRVGESGPEWFVPNEPGQIVPSGKLTGGGGVGGMTIVVNVAGSVRADRDLARVIRDEFDRMTRYGNTVAA